MKSSPILRIALSSPLRHTFDYLLPENIDLKKLQPGMRVKIPFRRKSIIGLFIESANQTLVNSGKLKFIENILDETPLLPPVILSLLHWVSDYYHHPIGEVMLNALPALLRQGKFIENNPISSKNWQINPCSTTLNMAQKQAVIAIHEAQRFQSFLLDGVTGSGKTEIYLQAIEPLLKNEKQVLILVPEIGLTPQTIARFQERFSAPIAVLHSRLNDKERLNAWLMAKSGEAAIIIGTRSAIFTPLQNPGMIILDEEHDLSFKQQSGFRYNARDVAIKRAQLENIPIVLGSATPSLESLYNAKRERFIHLQLPMRAGNAQKSIFHRIDLRNQHLEEGLSKPLLTAIQIHLEKNNQVLLFLNRRGFAPVLLCHVCGWTAKCHRCDARLTFHYEKQQLCCHHCNGSYSVSKNCPSCNSANLLMLGLGTERLEKALKKHFSDVSLIRIDRDSTRRKGTMEKMLETIHKGERQILIGTQMLTKGHHFPNVTLVGIIEADNSLYSSDFRALERMGQLIIQAAGRAGREEKKGEVFIQTHQPDHPYLLHLIQQDYSSFANALLQERQMTQLPPYAFLVMLRAEAVNSSAPMEFLNKAAQYVNSLANKKLKIYGPVPDLMERKAGRYRAQLMLHSSNRLDLQNTLKKLVAHIEKIPSVRKVRWSLDIDPMET